MIFVVSIISHSEVVNYFPILLFNTSFVEQPISRPFFIRGVLLKGILEALTYLTFYNNQNRPDLFKSSFSNFVPIMLEKPDLAYS